MYFRNLKRSQPLPPRPSSCCNGFVPLVPRSLSILWSHSYYDQCDTSNVSFLLITYGFATFCVLVLHVFFLGQRHRPPDFQLMFQYVWIGLNVMTLFFFYQKRYYVIQSIGCSHRVTSSRSFPGSRHLQGHVPLTAGVIPVSFSRNFSTDFDHPKEFDDQVCHDPKVSNGL